ncbi:flagellar motor switch protein FliG [Derxia gummosa]|uniref:Flagellar motor switch protein FliG n=1 Tax=Derxia gummosa DSM 723 TaxID=1121388 RepID=A0A8B6X683_9BURK|nr:flagellar motor switch protein FliG [Derxia gummosa]
MAAEEDEGLSESAILLMTLGTDAAAEVFKHLSPKEVQKLGETMAKLQIVPKERVDLVVKKFHQQIGLEASLVADTDNFVRETLVKALGEEKAGFLLDRILQGKDVSGIEGLKWMDASTVAELVRNEHPQIIASIVVHLERDHASEILKQLPERTRNDVMMRVATLDGIQPHALRELNDVLAKMLAGSDKIKKTQLGGIRAAAEMLNFMGSAAETSVIQNIMENDNDLAQKILDEMFTFDNILDIDDRGIQTILREVQTDSLVVALKGTDKELQEKIFKNMSKRAAETLREDLESKGPVRLSEVEAEQKEILKIVRRLADEGQIQLGGGGDDSFV